MPLDAPKAGESRDNYLNYCIPIEIESGKSVEQATAICASIFDKEKMSKITNTSEKVMARVAYDTNFRGINLQDDGLENACWDGYIAVGLKPMGDRMVPNCVPETENMQEVGKEINVLGYNTKNFKICPGAVGLFQHLQTMELDEDTIGMIRSAAQIADNIFGIEKEVLQTETATPEQLNEAVLLVNDFKDLMEEIDEEVGMVHDVSFMDGHIEVIKSYM